jgi:hypothetical protein
MPYRGSDGAYTFSGPPGTAWTDWEDPWWNLQWNTNTFNLDERNLPFSALIAPLYYSARSTVTGVRAADPAAIEDVLRSGREVMWLFLPGGNKTARTWQYDPSIGPGDIVHCMLIVGFDNTNPQDQYFICKNSWGPATWPAGTRRDASTREDGWTYISYEYLRRYGSSAGYIVGVNPPRPRPELAFIGRWNLCFDGWRGTLDISHIPTGDASMEVHGVEPPDRRLGTFRDPSGRMYRVNGWISGNQICFWFKPSPNDNMRWDELPDGSGRVFLYSLLPWKREMAGWHQDNSTGGVAAQWPGYALKDGDFDRSDDDFMRPVFNNALPRNPEMYLGRWWLAHQSSGWIRFLRRDDTRLPLSHRPYWAGLVGTFKPAGSSVAREFVAMVDRGDPARIVLPLPLSDTDSVSLVGRMLSWQRGVVAGRAFYAVRVGDP